MLSAESKPTQHSSLNAQHSVRRRPHRESPIDCRLRVAVIVAAGLARAQDPRVEPPKTPAEWFSALEFELNTGQYEAALFYLRGFLASNPTDKDLVAIERDRGFAAFLRLRSIRWSTDPKIDAEGRQLAEQAIERVNAAVRRELGDPQRIARYIRNLSASRRGTGLRHRRVAAVRGAGHAADHRHAAPGNRPVSA